MSTQTILKRNDTMIKAETDRLENLRKNYFEPFHEELKKTGFSVSIVSFKTLCNGNKEELILWLKNNTIDNTPAINDLPITKEAKLNMIALKDYSSLYNRFDILSANISIKSSAYYFDADKNDNLKLCTIQLKNIEDNFTLYGNEKQTEAFNTLNEIVEKIEGFKVKFGFNPFIKSANTIRIDATGEIFIQPERLNVLIK
jgi:ankyrin repeat protein